MHNSAEVKRIKLKCKHEKKKEKKIRNTFQNTHRGTAFEDFKVNRLTTKFKIKV